MAQRLPDVTACLIRPEDMSYRGAALLEEFARKWTDAVEAHRRMPDLEHRMEMRRVKGIAWSFAGDAMESAARFLCARLEKSGKRTVCLCPSEKMVYRLDNGEGRAWVPGKDWGSLGLFNKGWLGTLFAASLDGRDSRLPMDADCCVIVPTEKAGRPFIRQALAVAWDISRQVYAPIVDTRLCAGLLAMLNDVAPNVYVRKTTV